MKSAEFRSLTKFMLTRGRRISRFGGSTTALATAGLVLFATVASASVVGTVNISSGNANSTVTGTSIAFSPPCDTTLGVLGAALLPGGCAQGQVSSLGLGPLGTPSGPLESTINGSPEINSAVFIAAINTGTTFPLIPFMEFLNSTHTAIGITVEADAGSFGTGAQTVCAGLAVNSTCSIYQGAIFTLTNKGAAGVTATLPFTGFAWDGSSPVRPANYSSFAGTFSENITTIPGVIGTGPGGVVQASDIQTYFGCMSGATTTAASCTALGNTIVTANTSNFFAQIVPVPEPETTAMTLIGAGLLAFGFWRRRSQA